MKRVSRIASQIRFGSNAVTLLGATDAYEFRIGDIFWTGYSEDPDHRRVGEHRVAAIDHETGVLYTEVPLVTASAGACYGDWIFIADRAPMWSPYP